MDRKKSKTFFASFKSDKNEILLSLLALSGKNYVAHLEYIPITW